MTSSAIDVLLTKYRVAITERERAEIERDLWVNCADAAVRAANDRSSWLAKLTGAVKNKISIRQLLLNAGPQIDLIWARIENDGPNGMPLATAEGRFKAAEEYAQRDKISLLDAVKLALGEYDTWPRWRTRDGQLYRRPPVGAIRRGPPRQRRKTPSAESERKFWFAIKNQLAEFARDRLDGVDHLTANALQRDFFIRLQALCDEFSGRINRTRSGARKNGAQDQATIKLAQVKDACLVLSIDPPARGAPIDLDLARRNKNRLVVQYHPDKHIDASAEVKRVTEEQYRQVIEAYTTLESYNEQIEAAQQNG